MQGRCERHSRVAKAAAVFVAVMVTWGATARAQEPAADAVAALRAEIATLRSEYEQRLAALERKLDALETKVGSSEAAPAAADATAAASGTHAEGEESPGETTEAGSGSAPAPAYAPPPPMAEPAMPVMAAAAPSQTSNYFNPSISLIGNFLAVAGHDSVEDLPSADLRESELGLQAVVDPYARADVFISIGEQDAVDVEEGYLTFTALPADLLAKVGRMRVSFGKINTLHLHVLPWPDEPLPIVDLLGGEEGWIGTGVSAARLIPLGDTFSELTGQVFRGTDGGPFAGSRHGDLAYNLHYRLFRDLTESTNLDLGLSYGGGPNDSEADAHTRLTGVDATLRWKPLQTATYRSFTARGELIRSQRQQPGPDANAIGWFLSGDYQLAKRWFVGARYESSEHAVDTALRDSGEALTLTYWPSEFSQLRGELRRRRYEGLDADVVANELLMQLQFAIGAHGAHPF